MSQNHQDVIRLLQVTDCHLGAESGEDLLGMDTDEGFHDVMTLLQQRETAIDLLVASGDIANKGQQNSYHRFLDLIQQYVQVPMAWLPGNHDLPSLMQSIGAGRIQSDVVQLDAWQIILLDSSVLGSEGGSLSEAELQRLENLLASSDKHNLIFVHHQPVPVGSAWVDTYVIDNAERLFAVLDRFDHVRAIVFGHVHQDFEAERNGVRFYATPSTCIQFKPGQEDFAVDRQMPGYRWFDLHADGSFATAVERIPEKDYGIDYDSAGY
ncbi:MAG: 3',5'-cyclic-AMP phosphodiesterase [Candidatus Pelagadaptatus aseana]|uniref:3',5'-cyclic-AMP phosphodiesterase n=1 Tax=Candidatus Pelagadaptatus aseana TaxID=3120508 RepID=UPI0039B22F50